MSILITNKSSTGTATAFTSEVWVTNGNGYGGSVSGDTATRNFATVQRNNGSDITYTARTTTTGDKFTINTAGIYAISYSDDYNTGGTQGISLNASSGSTAIASLAINQILAINRTALANYEGTVTAIIHCAVNDVLRAQTGADPGGTPDIASFRVTRIG